MPVPRPDPYRPLAAMMPLAEPVQQLVMRKVVNDLVYISRAAEGRSVLDVCCGRGGLLKRLKRAGGRVMGIDMSPTMLKGAKTAGVPLVRGAAADLPFRVPFETVTCMLALHEMDPKVRNRTLRTLRQAVGSGGQMLLVDFVPPARPSIKARIGRFMIERDERGIGVIHPPHYANYRSFMVDEGGLVEWVKGQGEKVREVRTYLGGNLALVRL